MKNTKIEWTEQTWNPSTGCNKISSGCLNCYAEKMSKRLKCMGMQKYANGFELTCHPETLREPYSWKKERIVFVNSMSDLFHENIPLHFIQEVFKVMNENPQHIFQVLTKRSENLLKYSNQLVWTENIWAGVTVEGFRQKYRIDHLREVPAKLKFLSCEPLLDDLGELHLQDIDWIIVGGESGPKARPMKKEWVENILSQAHSNDIAFFFKQWGGVNKKKNGRMLNGRTYSEMPKITNALRSINV
jgi:protein gp37